VPVILEASGDQICIMYVTTDSRLSTFDATLCECDALVGSNPRVLRLPSRNRQRFQKLHKSQSALSGALIVSGPQAAKAFAIPQRLCASSLDSLFLKHHPGINSYSAISMSKHRVEVELFYVGVLLHKVGDF